VSQKLSSYHPRDQEIVFSSMLMHKGARNFIIYYYLVISRIGEVITDYPLYTRDVMQITELSRQTLRRQVRGFRLPFPSTPAVSTYVFVYPCIHIQTVSNSFCVTFISRSQVKLQNTLHRDYLLVGRCVNKYNSSFYV